MHIETPRLVLRYYRTEDWSRVHIYAQNPQFSKFEMWGPNSEAEPQKFIEDMVTQAAEGEGR